MESDDEEFDTQIHGYLKDVDLYRTYADDPDGHKRVSFIRDLYAET